MSSKKTSNGRPCLSISPSPHSRWSIAAETCLPYLWKIPAFQSAPRSPTTSRLGHEVDFQQPVWLGDWMQGLLERFLGVRRRRRVDWVQKEWTA